MGFADWFSFKSPEQRAREEREYANWAFPYGQEQKETVLSILKELLPEENNKTAMAIFLIGREGYKGSAHADPVAVAERTREDKLCRTVFVLRPHLSGRNRRFLSRYVALIEADGSVDEGLEYPSVEQLCRNAQELEPLLRDLL